MPSDAQWAVLEPLVVTCRPGGKTPPQDLRRTLSAILWRHQNGARWRAAQIFIRWSRLGVWSRLLGLVQARGVAVGVVFLNGTTFGLTRRRQGRRAGAISGRARRS